MIAAHWNRFAALAAADPDGRRRLHHRADVLSGPAIALIVAVSAMAMMLPAAVGVLISEAFAIRSWIFHAANGAMSAWIGQTTMVEMREPYDFYSDAADRGRRRHRGGLRLLGGRRLERGLLEAGVHSE